jgi:dihydrofolate reductase
MSDAPKLALIVAMSQNQVIGKNNQLLWQLPADMAHFKNTTAEHAVIMGSKTYESLPSRFRPLPNRFNIILSRTEKSHKTENLLWVDDTQKAFHAGADYARKKQQDCYFVIGGGMLYAQALPRADILYVTHVETDYDGDAFFPTFDPQDWVKTVLSTHPSENGQPSFTITRYDRVI